MKTAAHTEFSTRREKLADLLEKTGADLFFCAQGPLFHYLTGIPDAPSERLTALAIHRSSRAEALAPSFEVTRVLQSGLGSVTGWEENEDPIAVAADLIRGLAGAAAAIALDGRFWFKDYQALAERLPGCRFINGWPILAELRMRKTADEIKKMAKACEITCDVVRDALATLPKTITEKELEQDIARRYKERGVEGGALVQSGENSAIPHGSATERVIQPCDVLLIDSACAYEGYFSDLTRTYVVEEASAQFTDVYSIVNEAQRRGIEKIRCSSPCEDADFAARTHIESKGFGPFFTHRLGHGIGLEIHEDPYLVKGNKALLDIGMAVTVEPGIYLEGEFGVRIEDVVVCGEEGPVVLTDALPKNIQVISLY